MSMNRRWIKRMIETARVETGPLPLARLRAARRYTPARPGVIRTTLQPKPR